MSELVSSNIPVHIALIMDGNGRWAKERNLPVIAGHRAGADSARAITERAAKLGVKYLTLYTFSSENWQREKSWIEDFMGLLRWYLRNELKQLMQDDVRVRVIGNRSLLPKDVQDLITEVEETTKDNSTITVALALSYGARDEILRAVRCIAEKVKDGEMEPQDITAPVFESCLDTSGMPDPDLLIRTSGEQRLSNYLLWQMAYTEFVFTPLYWPDFTADEFEKSIHEFQQRKRRYGLYISE